ncbi:HIT domain-containing protein [Dermatophilaceae bacterium Soc4.6]
MIAPGCLFCRIVEGQVPAEVVSRTALSLAFRDLSPQAPTHVLVIPRRHVADLGELAEHPDDLADAVRLARDVARAEGLDHGYRVIANTGSQAGQTVYHAHLHVLGGRDLGWPPG